MLARNEAFANDFPKGNVPLRPNRKVAVLACMDARLDVYRLLGLGLGELLTEAGELSEAVKVVLGGGELREVGL